MTTPSSVQPPPAHSRFAAWVPYVVLLLSLAATVVAGLYVSASTWVRNRARFEQLVQEAREEVETRMQAYVGALSGLAGLFAANEDITDVQFKAYVDRLNLGDRHPGVTGLGFSKRGVAGKGLTLDASSDPEFEDHSIIMIEPRDDRNAQALHHNMFSEPVRRAAMKLARDTGAPAASGKVNLLQQGVGFLIYVPVYRGGHVPATEDARRQRLLGFVYSPFLATELFTQIVVARKGNTALRMNFYDGEETIERAALFRSAAEITYPPSFRKALPLEIAGRRWNIEFFTTPTFEVEAGRDLTPFVFILGTVVSMILFLLTRAQARARRGAERMAYDMQLTERALRYSESRFRRLAESNLIGVVFSDVFGSVTDGNDAYFDLIGVTRADALAGRVRWDTITPPEWQYADERALAELRARGVAEPFEKEYMRPDGTRVPVLIGVAMLEGSSTDTVAFVVDLTERHRTERDLVRAMQSAEAANHAKDQFLAVLSHELRTPLTPVLAIAASAQNDPQLSEQLRGDFAMIRRNVELEAKLIDDLLDLTKIGRGKLQIHVETVDAHQALRSALHVTSADEIAMKRLSIESQLNAELHHVRGDPARLQQVFWNLLKNAVKFTPAGGTITVTTWNDDRTRLHISVADTGIGIEPEVLPRIFDAFEQGEIAKARAFGGLGLGLAISKGLIDAHGGTITAYSDGKDRGTTFTVVLDTVPVPVYRTRPGAAPARPAAPVGVDGSSVGSISVLLVEDHQDTAKALYRLLQRCGYSVTAADSVNSALRVAAQTDFDVVVSDLGLPDGSGLDLIRELRLRGPFKAIALTGYGMEEDVARSLEAGFNEHLTKPVNFQNLRATIERITSTAAAGVD